MVKVNIENTVWKKQLECSHMQYSKKAEQENFNSASSHHLEREKHIMDWEEAQVIHPLSLPLLGSSGAEANPTHSPTGDLEWPWWVCFWTVGGGQRVPTHAQEEHVNSRQKGSATLRIQTRNLLFSFLLGSEVTGQGFWWLLCRHWLFSKPLTTYYMSKE